MEYFIEQYFPFREVGKEAVRERLIRKGHISTLHVWWSRKPLTVSRAILYSSLIPFVEENKVLEKGRFVYELSKWENSLNNSILESAKKDIFSRKKHIRFLDPFAGGGSIPYEALRLGLEIYANDYNPVSVFIVKCLLEYPNQFDIQKLINDITYWSKWILHEVKKEVSSYYPSDFQMFKIYNFYWMHFLECPNCGLENPLTLNFWLAKKKDRKIALKPIIEGNKVRFEIVGQNNDFPKDFDPNKGTISKGRLICLSCGNILKNEEIRFLFQENKVKQKIVSVSYRNFTDMKRMYRISNEKDMKLFYKIAKNLEKEKDRFIKKWGFNPLPNEKMNSFILGNKFHSFYGLEKWEDIFNDRQKLVLISFLDKILQSYNELIKKSYNQEYSKVVVSYLALIFNSVVHHYNQLSSWRSDFEESKHIFVRPTFSFVWDYSEVNPLVPVSGSWSLSTKKVCNVLKNIPKSNEKIVISNDSATKLSYPNDFFDVIFTDPPYYDYINYGDISDLFYVWLKRSVGFLYPELFSTELVPKSEEITINARKPSLDGKKKFIERLNLAFQEIHRVLKRDGILILVYAYKSISGWSVLIDSILKVGFRVVATWPVKTEMENRSNAIRTASLSVSIYFVMKKLEKKEVVYYENIYSELKNHIFQKLEFFWQQRVSGIDFFMTGIGVSIEFFSLYSSILEKNGMEIPSDVLVKRIEEIILEYTFEKVVEEVPLNIYPATKFYLFFKKYYKKDRISLEDLNNFLQSIQIEFSRIEYLLERKENYVVIKSPSEFDMNYLKSSNELIDRMFFYVNLWCNGKEELFKQYLENDKYLELYYRLAQALSLSLKNNSKEKKSLDRFLFSRDKVVFNGNIQLKLFI